MTDQLIEINGDIPEMMNVTLDAEQIRYLIEFALNRVLTDEINHCHQIKKSKILVWEGDKQSDPLYFDASTQERLLTSFRKLASMEDEGIEEYLYDAAEDDDIMDRFDLAFGESADDEELKSLFELYQGEEMFYWSIVDVE